MDPYTDTSELIRRVVATHYTTEAQCVAVDTVVSSVLDGDIVWTSGKAEEPVEDTIPWTEAATRIIRQLLIFGYALYRVAKVRKPIKGEHAVDSETRRIEVANGVTVVPTWNGETRSWNFIVPDGEDTSGWRVLVHVEPDRDHNNRPILRSGAARAYEPSIRLAEMEACHAQRDTLNSMPAIIAERATTIGGGYNNPLDERGRDPASTMLGDARPDLRSWAHKQKDLIRYLSELSEESERQNEKRMKAMKADPKEAKRPKLDLPDAHLRVFDVPAGKSGREVTPRVGPPEYPATVSALENKIMWAFGVAPQVKARGVNSERKPSSDRMSQMVIADFERFVRIMRRHVDNAFATISEQLSRKRGIHVFIKPRMSAFSLQQIRPVLKTEELRRRLAQVYDIPEDAIDDDKLEADQMGMVGGDENRKHNSHDVDGGGHGVPVQVADKSGVPAQLTDKDKANAHAHKHMSSV